jgi:hypothetical protein
MISYLNYLSMSRTGLTTYLESIIELADLALKNQGKSGITEETIKMATEARRDATETLRKIAAETCGKETL